MERAFAESITFPLSKFDSYILRVAKRTYLNKAYFKEVAS